MMNRIYIESLFLLIFVSGCGIHESKSTPNILICIADDAGHMGKDYTWVKTPAFDRVVAEEILFSNIYTPIMQSVLYQELVCSQEGTPSN